MSTWKNATPTVKGYALQGKLLSSGTLNITKVKTGSGRVNTDELVNQTDVTNAVQELAIEALTYQNNGSALLQVLLDNYTLENGYDLNQIGIYADDPDEGEILYLIAQADEAEQIPSKTEQPTGYTCEWSFYLSFGASAGINVTITPNAFLTPTTADARYSPIKHNHEMENIEGLSDELAQKSSIQHKHAITDVSNLGTALEAINTAIDGKSTKGHTHDISNISGLQSELNRNSQNMDAIRVLAEGKQPLTKNLETAGVTDSLSMTDFFSIYRQGTDENKKISWLTMMAGISPLILNAFLNVDTGNRVLVSQPTPQKDTDIYLPAASDVTLDELNKLKNLESTLISINEQISNIFASLEAFSNMVFPISSGGTGETTWQKAVSALTGGLFKYGNLGDTTSTSTSAYKNVFYSNPVQINGKSYCIMVRPNPTEESETIIGIRKNSTGSLSVSNSGWNSGNSNGSWVFSVTADGIKQ